MLALVATLTLVFTAQDKGPSAEQQKALLEAYFAASATTPQGLAERRRVLAEFALVPATPAAVVVTQKAVQKLWEKGRELDKSNGQAFFWEQEKKGLYIVGGNVKKPKALAICMHGGGAGSGDAWSAQGGYDPALKGLDWLAIYPEVLEKTEHGWTDAGTEEWVLELLECARRTWKIDANKVFLCGHSMGGYGSWTLGAHHADQLAAVAPSAGAPTPYMNREGKFTGVSAGIIPNLRRRFDDGAWDAQTELDAYRALRDCPECKGGRLRSESRAARMVPAATASAQS